MAKNKILLFMLACFIIVFTVSAIFVLMQETTFSEKDFPLEIDLSKTNYNVGEKIAFNATIINRSGKDVNIWSNGQQPWAFFYNINDTTPHGETTMRVDQVFKSNEEIIKNYEYEAKESGTYILEVQYHIYVNNIVVQEKIENIVISVA